MLNKICVLMLSSSCQLRPRPTISARRVPFAKRGPSCLDITTTPTIFACSTATKSPILTSSLLGSSRCRRYQSISHAPLRPPHAPRIPFRSSFTHPQAWRSSRYKAPSTSPRLQHPCPPLKSANSSSRTTIPQSTTRATQNG
jgi:hypothetical protein